ncbi:MAG TPA: TatD family hydrolase [Candidatus Paceibacterota bacterium]
MNLNYIDIHCHLDSPDYGEELPKVLERMREKNIGAITIGTDLESSRRAVHIAEENENIWACIGVHPIPTPSPSQGEGWGEVQLEFEKLIQSASRRTKVVAIGECGLDFFRVAPENLEKEKERQTALFRKQIEFALKYDKPLMLHCRQAYDEVLEILEEYRGAKLRGDCHFFAGNVDQAKRFVELGFSCSFTGVITFTHDYDEVIKSLPQDMIMSETDAPFVAPVPYRGKRNEPSYVAEVVKKMAEIRGEELENLAKVLVHNAERLFGLK